MIHQRTLLRLLLTPSFVGGFFTIFVTVGILGYSGWLFLQGDKLFYDYLFGAYGLHTFIWKQSLGLSGWYQAFLASPQAYYLLVIGAALVVGITVFTLLQGFGVLKRNTREAIQDVESTEPGRRRAGRELLLRFGLRISSVIGWVIFAAFFVSSIVPFTIVLNQTGIHQWADEHHAFLGVLLSFLAGLLLALSIHIQVIFVRLCLLRPRVFHANIAIEEAEATEVE